MSKDVVDRLVKLFVAGDAHGMVALCQPDALVDVNVPQWRFQIHPDALLAGLRENTELPDRSVAVGYLESTSDGAVVEVETRGTIKDEPGLIREVWLIRTDGAKVTEWISYCTAPWDAATIARQRAEAPMIRKEGGRATSI